MPVKSHPWVWAVVFAAGLCWPGAGIAGEFGDGEAIDNPALRYPAFSGRCVGDAGEVAPCPEALNCVPSLERDCAAGDWVLRGADGEPPPPPAPFEVTWSVTKSVSGEYQAGSAPRYLASLRPRVDFVRDGTPGTFHADAGARFRYLADDSAYLSGFDAGVVGALDLGPTSSLFASSDLDIDVPDPDDTDLPADTASVPVTVVAEGEAGWRQRFGPISTELRAGAGRALTTDTVLDDLTVIDNAELGRTGWGGGARIGADVTPIWGVFVDAEGRRETYDAPSAGFGVALDNTTYHAEAGVAFERDETLSGEISLGGLRRGFDDVSLGDVTTYVADASLGWSPTRRTALSATLSTDVTPTTEPGATTEVSRLASVEASYDASDAVRLHGSVSAELDTFPGVPEQTSTTSVGVGIDYIVNRFASLFATLTGTAVADTTDGESQRLGFEAGFTVSH